MIAVASSALVLMLSCVTKPPPSASQAASMATAANSADATATRRAAESTGPSLIATEDPHADSVAAEVAAVPSSEPPTQPESEEDVAVLSRLSATASTPARFAKSSDHRFLVARGILQQTKQSIRSGTWREVKGKGCAVGQLALDQSDHLAIAIDAKARIRTLTILGGTEDHFHEIRYFYDDAERLRVLFVKYADVHGGITENIVYYDPKGAVAACDSLDLGHGSGGWNLCEDESRPIHLDPEVAKAIQPQLRHGTQNELRERLQAVEPRQIYQRCLAHGNAEAEKDSQATPIAPEQTASPSRRLACETSEFCVLLTAGETC